MPVSSSQPIITFEAADDPAFTQGVETQQFNVRAVALNVESEEILKFVSGERALRLQWAFEVEFEPFSTNPQTSFHDSSDKIRLVTMLATKPHLRIVSVSQLGRYAAGGIAEAKTLIENKRVSFNGSFSTSLQSERARESVSATFTTLTPVLP